jgi:hypothetical protein
MKVTMKPTIRRNAWMRMPPIFLVLAVIALYGRFLWNPIVFDDLPFFMVDRNGHQPVSDYHFSLFELRSFPYATLAWTKAWFGLELIYFRVGNVLLHAAVAVALFFFLDKLLAHTFASRNSVILNSRYAAFCAALLFALHPVAVYAAGYLVQRTVVMATLFGLLAMLAYLQGSLQGKKWWLWSSVPLYYLAVLCKEHAIMLPAILLALTVLLHSDWRTQLRQRWGVIFAFVLIALFVVIAKQGVIGSAYEVNAPEMLGAGDHSGNLTGVSENAGNNFSHLLSALTQSGLFFKYLALWLLPNPDWMSVDMREPFATSLLSPYWLAMIAYIAWGVGGGWLLLQRGLKGLLGFAMLFPWLMFMTEFSTVRIQESFVLYRSYLWAAGIFCGWAVLLSTLRKRMVAVVMTAVVVMMFPISVNRLQTFSHPLLLWDDAEKLVQDKLNLPGVNRIYYNRGNELLKVKKHDLAITDFKQAIALQPEWPYPHHNLGSAYLEAGRWREAADAFGLAIAVGQQSKFGVNPKSYFGRARSLESMNEIEQARADYRESCRLIGLGCEKL